MTGEEIKEHVYNAFVCDMFYRPELSDAIYEMVDENAKLRELLKNALTYIEYEGCGVECPETGNSATLTSCDTCNRYETESCAYVIEQDARELGIEVQ